MIVPNVHHLMNGYILAGGKSSRMGADKGLVLLNNKPMIHYVIEQLKPLCKSIFIVTSNSEYNKLGLECIADEIHNIGPAGGIYSALKHTDTAHNFIVSCDTPFVKTEGIKYIMQHSLDHEITLPVCQKQLHPLCGVYSKDIFERWKTLVDSGERKMQSMVEHFIQKKIVVDSVPLFNNYFFKNVNTPDELLFAQILFL